MSKPRIFIDGEAGTTGLQIRARLHGRTDLELLSIDPALRKDEGERKRLLNAADVSILCLPDEAAREAVSWIDNPNTRVLDPSSAHRVSDGWTYGLPELTPGQVDAIRASKRVSVPGCYSTGMIALVRPLVDAGLLSPDQPLTVNGASGYSGGGRQLIDAMEGRGEHRLAGPYRAYALELSHKHMPEMRQYGALTRAPLFTPNVGAWRQGMLVSVPLPLWALPGKVTATDLRSALEAHYAGSRFVRVVPQDESPDVLDPETLNGTNDMELFVYDNAQHEHALLVARLDNLGKGASGQAAQCLDLMLGLDGQHDYSVSEEAVGA